MAIFSRAHIGMSTSAFSSSSAKTARKYTFTHCSVGTTAAKLRATFPTLGVLMRQWLSGKIAVVSLTMLVCVVGTPQRAHAELITTVAVSSDSIGPDGTDWWHDNMVRAYTSEWLTVDGFMGFDLALIPDDATILSVTLTTYFHGFGGFPQYGTFGVYQSLGTSFTMAADDPYPGLGDLVSREYTGAEMYLAQTTSSTFTWEIDPSAITTSDLIANTFALALHNSSGSYSYAYFNGAAVPATAPQLTIDWERPAPTASVPEPATLAVLGVGMVGAALTSRRRRTSDGK